MKKTKAIIFIILFLISIGGVIYATSLSYYNDYTVYVTDTGSKYHALGCDTMKSRPKRTTVKNAEAYGYSPCKVCNPYGLATEFYGENTKESNSSELATLLLGLAFYTFFYMILPIIFKINKSTWYSYSDLHQFVILNSVLASIIMIVFLSITNPIEFQTIFATIILAVIFAFINYKLLENNIAMPTTKFNKEEDTKIGEKSPPKKYDEDLPMSWFKFWFYFRIPAGIILTLGSLFNLFAYNDVNAIFGSIVIMEFLINTSYTALLIATFWCFRKRYKIGYALNLLCLGLQIVINSANQIVKESIESNQLFSFSDFLGEVIALIFIMALIWGLPNYIYFKKRKNYFNKELNIKL